MGGGNGSFAGYLPPGAVVVPQGTQPIMAAGSTGFMLDLGNAYYWMEIWAEGSYQQRLTITAVSKVYGGGLANIPTHNSNARMVANYNANGILIYDGNNRNGIMYLGNGWSN